MKKLLIRAASGAIYVAVILLTIFLGGLTAFPALCIIFAFIGAYELLRMADNGRPLTSLDSYDILATGLIAALPLVETIFSLRAATLLAVLSILIRMVIQIFSRARHPERLASQALLSYIYVGGGLALTATLFMSYHKWVALLMFLMIWLNDTGAYLVGTAIGRHKMSPRLSPKKSWEGFAGGLVLCTVTPLFVRWLTLLCGGYFPDMSTPALCLTGAAVSILATWGDLFESMIKRSTGVKDSGKLIPGHGGILDRIDSLLFVAPALWIILQLCLH